MTPRTRGLLEFAVHILVGALLFSVIGVAVLALGWMVNFLRSSNYPDLVVIALGLAEYTVLGLDVLLLLIFVFRSGVRLFRAFWS